MLKSIGAVPVDLEQLKSSGGYLGSCVMTRRHLGYGHEVTYD